MYLNNYVSLLALCLLLSCGLHAQVFWSEDFSGGGIPAGWTNVDQTSVPGEEVLFVHTTDITAVEAASLDAPEGAEFTAATAANGYLWANSDRGLSAAPVADHLTELTTTAIDCSGESTIWFQMQALIGVFVVDAQDNAILRVSTDNANWDEYVIFPGLTTSERWSETPQMVAVDISETAAGQSTVYLQLQWAGSWEYFWAIDDLQLTNIDPRPANDMRVNTFAAVAPNAIWPASQVEPIGFIADIENVGSGDQTSATLNISITDSGGTEVFSADNEYGGLVSDSLAENVLFSDEFDVPAVAEDYTGTYSLSYPGSETDANPENNSLSFTFSVSDTLFAKETGANTSVTPVDDASYTYGNVFYIQDGTNLFARYIQFGIANADELAGETLTTFLYEWEGDLNGDMQASADEYFIVGFNSYTVTGAESATDLISVVVSLDDAIQLQSDKYYIVAIQYATSVAQDFFFPVSSERNYNAMNFYTDSIATLTGDIKRERYASALDVGNEGTFNLFGFAPGFDLVPVVRLSVGENPLVSSREAQLPDNAVRLFPNPVVDKAYLEFDLADASAATIEVYSTEAKHVIYRELDNIQRERLELDTTKLPSGNYLVRIVTDQGMRTLKMIVQH